MEFDHQLFTFISSLSGTGVAVALGKWIIQRALKTVDNVAAKVTSIDTSLAVMMSRLQAVERHEVLLQEHDRKIVSLESKYGKKD